VNRIENVLDKDGGVFFEEIWNLSLAQGPYCVFVSVMSQQREDIVCENIGICI
jgi:hypothetical protein